MKHPTGRIVFSYLLVLSLVACQPSNPWREKFSIVNYQDNLEAIAAQASLDSFDIRAFEDYLLQHPFTAEGKTFQEIFIATDTVRQEQHQLLSRRMATDTLLFRRKNHLVPDPADSAAKNLIFKVFLYNLKSPDILGLDVQFPASVWKDSTWVDSVAVFDKVKLAAGDSLELYAYPVAYDQDAYLVGSSRLGEPLEASQISPPELYVQNFKLVDKVSGTKAETVFTCLSLEDALLLDNGGKPAFAQYEDTGVVINIPCLRNECTLALEVDGAFLEVEYRKDKKTLYKIMPFQAEFTVNIYSTCLPDSYLESTPGKKIPFGGKNLLTTLNLKAKE